MPFSRRPWHLLRGAQVFLEGDDVTVEEPPDRADTRPHRIAQQSVANFRQRQAAVLDGAHKITKHSGLRPWGYPKDIRHTQGLAPL